jgi:hypothetical protein
MCGKMDGNIDNDLVANGIPQTIDAFINIYKHIDCEPITQSMLEPCTLSEVSQYIDMFFM